MGELHRHPKNLKRSILIRPVGTPAAVIRLMTASQKVVDPQT